MNIIKRMLIVFNILSILLVSVNAEESTPYFYRATVDLKTGEAELEERNIMGEKDYSNLQISVIKMTQLGDKTEVYGGSLGGYDNGRWKNVDFSDNQPLLIYDWQTQDNFWVIPLKNTENIIYGIEDDVENDSQSLSLNSETIQPSLEIVESIYINNSEITNNFTSQSITGNDTLFARYTIINSGTQTQSVQLILCIYSTEGRMLNMAVISDTIESNETKDIEKSLTIASNISACYAKVFLWDGLNSLRPLHDTLQIGSQNVSVEVATATVDCVQNKEYNLVTTVENMPTNDDGQYTITYNPSKLDLLIYAR